MTDLLSFALGDKPEPYDWRGDERARPTPEERRDLGVHADQDALRQIEIKRALAQIRIDRWKDRKLLVAILALLLGQFVSVADLVQQAFAAIVP